MVACAEIVSGYYARKINARQCITLKPCALNDPMATWIQKKKSKVSFALPSTGSAINHGKSDGFSAPTPKRKKKKKIHSTLHFIESPVELFFSFFSH
jgi:hypothetical protein